MRERERESEIYEREREREREWERLERQRFFVFSSWKLLKIPRNRERYR